ncbi:Solute carrier family 2, facilitated glucose transporter member 2 [Nosema granulosis]|uniref:Solute carrier family 2, facilitated glucose transporter member 2 n=1 Tax=Nosema granulosis TaxID=83296 RepID=A0A9P6GXT8_9MICR|nr:Solute carrier family 2, facilitated glucose transporter member 2 [Nosema granulosis]
MPSNKHTHESIEFSSLDSSQIAVSQISIKEKISLSKRVFNIAVLSLSSISFGYGLTSMETFSKLVDSSSVISNYDQATHDILIIFATSNVFLGGFFSNILIRYLPFVERKRLLIGAALMNSVAYFAQYLFPQIIVVSISRIAIGLSSGIVCSIVPNFLLDFSPKSLKGFIPSIHSVGICIGIVLGYGLGKFNCAEDYHIPMFLIIVYSLLNAFLLLFTKEVKEKESIVNQVGVFPLLRLKTARKSLLTACIFHLSQHLSGVDFVSLFSKKFIGLEENYYLIILSSLSLAIPCSFLSSILLDKVGRKPMMLLSCGLLSFVTLLFGLTNYHKILIYSFVLSYNLGVATVPWIITNDIFPKEYFKSGNMIGVTVNWLSAYILAVSAASIFDFFGEIVWYCFSGSMILVSIFTALVMKETSHMATPEFL